MVKLTTLRCDTVEAALITAGKNIKMLKDFFLKKNRLDCKRLELRMFSNTEQKLRIN